MRLSIVPVTFAEANAFVAKHHRHHKQMPGCKFVIACADGERVCGVAMVGRPVARMLDDGWTLEVNRLATDGTKNACSILYAAAWRTARAMGYRKLVTYILASEPAGWKSVGEVNGRSWDCASRPRVDKHPTQDKIRWEAAGEHAAPIQTEVQSNG